MKNQKQLKIRLITEESDPDLYELDEAEDIAQLVVKKLFALNASQWKQASQGKMASFSISIDEFGDRLQSIESFDKAAVRVVTLSVDKDEGFYCAAAFDHTDKNNVFIELDIIINNKGNMPDDFMHIITSSIAHELNHYYDFLNKRNNLNNDDITVQKLHELSPFKDKIYEFLDKLFATKFTKLKELSLYYLDIREIRSMTKEIIKRMRYNSMSDNDFEFAAENYLSGFNIKGNIEPGAELYVETLENIIVHFWDMYFRIKFKK